MGAADALMRRDRFDEAAILEPVFNNPHAGPEARQARARFEQAGPAIDRLTPTAEGRRGRTGQLISRAPPDETMAPARVTRRPPRR